MSWARLQAKQLHLVSWQWSSVSLSTPTRNVERSDLVQGGTSWAKQAERSESKVVTEKWAQLDLAHNMLDNDHKKCGARKSLPRRKDELDRQANEQSVRWWQKYGHSSTLRIISQQTEVGSKHTFSKHNKLDKQKWVEHYSGSPTHPTLTFKSVGEPD